MKEYWKIMPTKYLKGWCPTFIPVTDDYGLKAVNEAMRLERLTGIKWSVTKVTR